MENRPSDQIRRVGINTIRAPNTSSPSVHPPHHVSDNASIRTQCELETELSKHQPNTHHPIVPPTSPSHAVRHPHNTNRTSHHITEHSRLPGTTSSSSIEFYTTEHGVVSTPTRDIHNAFHKTQHNKDTDTGLLPSNDTDTIAGLPQGPAWRRQPASQPDSQPARWSAIQTSACGGPEYSNARAAIFQQRGAAPVSSSVPIARPPAIGGWARDSTSYRPQAQATNTQQTSINLLYPGKPTSLAGRAGIHFSGESQPIHEGRPWVPHLGWHDDLSPLHTRAFDSEVCPTLVTCPRFRLTLNRF